MSAIRCRVAINEYDDHMALLMDGRWHLLRQISGDDWYFWFVNVEDTGQTAEAALAQLMAEDWAR